MHVLLCVSEIEDGKGVLFVWSEGQSAALSACMSSYLYSVLYASKDVMAIG